MRKAFTLIELLIVIAIIGILASVVIISLEGSQGKTADEISKTELGQLRTFSAILKSDHPGISFDDVDNDSTTDDTGFCDGITDDDEDVDLAGVETILDSIEDRQGTNTVKCVNDATVWAAFFSLIETRSDAAAERTIWCVDSTGYVGELNSTETDLLADDGTDITDAGVLTPEDNEYACED